MHPLSRVHALREEEEEEGHGGGGGGASSSVHGRAPASARRPNIPDPAASMASTSGDIPTHSDLQTAMGLWEAEMAGREHSYAYYRYPVFIN